MERRLTTILAADVVGYSRLMGANETGTLAALKALQTDFIDRKIAEYQGRIVKLTGDGMLVEFPSVVSAVACAADIQRGMRTRNANVPSDARGLNSASALMLATLLWKGKTSWAMALMWRLDWKALRRLGGSPSHSPCATTSAND